MIRPLAHVFGPSTFSRLFVHAAGTVARFRLRNTAFALIVFACVSAASANAADSTGVGTVHLTQGWVTFGQAVPQGKAAAGLQVEGVITQTDVKTRWPDGSIRFAVVTVKAPAAGDYAVLPGTASGGSFSTGAPNASATFTTGGVVYRAVLPVVGSNAWLTGPLVNEGRFVVTPVAGDGARHPFLRVNFDSRVYNDGVARVDVSVENVLDKPGATSMLYDVAININGAPVFSKSNVTHYYLTRWRKVFDVGSAGAFGSVVPDLKPFNESRALPPYLDLVANLLDDASTGHYDILESGELGLDMSAHGGRGSLAPFPDWTARYLVHKNPQQRAFVLANGDLSGSWPVHVREDEGGAFTGVGDGRLVSLNQRPFVWYDERAETEFMEDGTPLDFIKGTPLPMREYSDGIPGPGQSPLTPDNAHQPSLAYVPYLLTGDRYYAEEVDFWANYSMLRTFPADGVRGSDGILENNEVRGFGWALRNIADAAAYSPDPVAGAYFSAKVAANLKWLDDYANAQDPIANPLQLLWIGYRPEVGFVSLWEQTYLAHAIDRANRQGFSGGLAHRNAIVNLQLRLFTDPAYPRETVLTEPITIDGVEVPAGTVLTWSAPYLVGAGHTEDPSVWDGPFTYNTTIAEVWEQTHDLNLQRDYAGFYGPEARLNLMAAIENGAEGAQGAYDYLWPFIGINNYWGDGSTSIPDLAQRAGWALDFYPASAAAPAEDTTPPAVTVPASVQAEATSPAGAAVTFSASATDAVDGSPAVHCVPASGSTFALGPTIITCSATDAAGNKGSASFTVMVVDTTPPALTVPASITANATSAAGATITFVASAVDLVDGATSTLCAPASGSTFGIRTTTVTCTSTDGHANTASRAFTVTVVAVSGETGIAPIADQLNTEGDHVRLEVTLVGTGGAAPRRAQVSSNRRDDDDDDEDSDRDDPRVEHNGVFTARDLPPGIRITRDGVIKGHLDKRSAGIYHPTVTFTERRGRTFSKGFTWTVRDSNRGRK